MWSDRVLRVLGADPRVFRPVYRAYRLMLSRPRLIRRRDRATGSDFLLLLFAGVYSMAAAALMLKARLPVLAGGLALTVGCGFLLLIVLADYAEALVHPAERLVLAAHPHDDRSLLLAKLAAVGLHLALLSAVLFGPACLVAAVLWGAGAALAFLAGAAGAAVAVVALGLLTAVLLVRSGGRRAMDRLMPWLHGGFQLGYLMPMAANQLFQPQRLSAATRMLLSWLLPTFWFTAPLELAAGGAGPAAAGRFALAAGSLALLAVAGGRLATGLGRRLLEPEPRGAAVARRRGGRAKRLAAFLFRFEGLRLLSLLRVHLRSDWRTRSEVLSLPVLSVVMLLLFSRQGGGAGWSVTFFYGVMLFVSADTLTRSRRPESLWWLLSSPIDRTRFSLATVPLLRLLMLVPISIALALIALRQPAPAGGSWPLRILSFLALVAYGDLVLVLGKGTFPEFPFSRAAKSAGGSSGERFARTLIGMPVSGVGAAAVLACQRFGAPGIAFGGLAAVVLHLPAFLWARRRTRRAAAELDLALLG
jgi:hypothetical protein